MHVEVKPVQYNKLDSQSEEESSKEIKQRVNNARKIQLERYRDLGIIQNSELNSREIEQYCKIDIKGKEILRKAFESLDLSARAYSKILKLSRTIADLDGKIEILPKHIAEAIQYRSLDRKYWKK